MRYAIILGLTVCITAADQLTKYFVVSRMYEGEAIAVTNFFNLVSVRNRGAAFGFLNDPSITWQFWLFMVATVAAVGLILHMAQKAAAHETPLFWGLGCIMGGAVGNAIDRVRFQAVVDFLDFHYKGWSWPAFNVADIAICLGAGLIAFLLLRNPKGQPTSNTKP